MNEQPVDPEAQARAASALEEGFAEIRTPDQAAHAVDQLERTSSKLRERDIPKNSHDLARQAEKIQSATKGHRGPRKTADMVEAAARAIAESHDAEQPEMDDAVAEAAGTGNVDCRWPEARRGQQLLRQELVRRLKPLDAVDATAFIAINNLPHPPVADTAMTSLTKVMTGGHAWLVPLGLGVLANRKAGLRAALGVLPALWLTTAAVEYAIKPFVRRRRPFISIVRAIVVGRKPGSYSFPSGHSAAAFAGAALLSECHPRYRRLFLAIAVLTAFSRVYLGAHYPGDVVSGSTIGVVLARFFRRLIRPSR